MNHHENKKTATYRQTIFYQWLSSFGLCHRDQVSPYYHEPFILHGYRPSPTTVTYCLKSIFLPTCETLNIWTHLLPGLFLLVHFVQFAQANLQNWNDPILYPYWIFAIGIILTFVGSTLAHLFNCISVGAREICFCCDYLTIALHGIGLIVAFTVYICPFYCIIPNSSVSWLFYLLLLLGNTFSAVISCYTRLPTNDSNKILLRVGSYVLLCTCLNGPCLYKYYAMPPLPIDEQPSPQSTACYLRTFADDRSLFTIVCSFLLFGAILHAGKVPERFLPGYFDIVGHSHQIFHLCTAVALYYETILVEKNVLDIMALRKTGKLFPSTLNITFLWVVIIPGVCAIFSCLLTAACAVHLHKHKTKKPRD